MPAYLAVDLGAESGRVLRGEFDGARLAVTEVHRFPNDPLRVPDGLYWDVERLRVGVLEGVARGLARGPGVRSVGVDAWGNDFGLLDGAGTLLARPWHHRTPRTAGMPQRLLDRIDTDALYALTGTQFLPITTACQLLAMQGAPVLERAQRLATVPDLVAGWLGGGPATEQTVASTSQLWDIRRGHWATALIERLGLPGHLFRADVVAPGTPLGALGGAAAGALGRPVPPAVVAVAGHDTASAVAAVPAGSAAFGYVCCGTWSLVGLELPEPITTPAARRARFTNEAGLAGSVRFLSNVNGLWLVQECRRAWWSAGTAPSYSALTAAAARAPGGRSLIDPDHPSLLGAGDMPARIAELCRATGQPVPDGRGALVRCILDSLACAYRRTLDRAAALAGRPVATVHLVGGGAANPLLGRLTADLTGRPVVAGPVEASGAGNLLVQAMADGELGGPADIRTVVQASFPMRTYRPRPGSAADETYGRFRCLAHDRATVEAAG